MRYLLAFLLFALVACSAAPAASTDPAAVVAAFEAAGLEAESPRPMTAQDYGVAPMAEEGVRFLIPSLGEDAGGRVMRYASAEEAAAAATFYKELGTESAALFSWAFQSGSIVVQINGQLPEAQARQYEAALAALP